jgi:hypothetical protein
MFLSKVDEKYDGFVVKKILELEELNCILRELVHEPSGAIVMHLENDDPENLFCLAFETLPYNSNGVAHVLEHTVLCGSKKFPVKDPFFAMTRRSLNTFMNALTGSDATCYPAASQVEKDFYNLLEVYLDAVFHPLLKEASFLQEGHRLEFTEPKDPKTPLQWKGIVYNEMKGALSSPDTRLWHETMAKLVPDLTYAYVSGGDPKVIPSLTFEQLISFHEIYYHPSRCLFFFYGNFPLKKHLDFIAEKELKRVSKQQPLPPMPLQKRFSEPVYHETGYPIAEGEDLNKKTFIVFGWLTAPVRDQDDILALTVLDAILMETDASLLKLPLLQSGLCLAADAYFDTEMSEAPYLIVCKGCEKKDAQELEHLIMKTLEKIIDDGIPEHLIEAAIHQLEFSRTEITGDHAPYGLTLFMRSALSKQHGAQPENALLIHSLFNKLLERAKDKSYLPGILKKYLLCNKHLVRLVLEPDVNLAANEALEEQKRLEAITEKLTPKEIKAVLKQTEALARYQKETEGQNLEVLPKVSLNDVPVLARDFQLDEKHHVFHHDCFTNQIVYADLAFDLAHIDEADLPYAQLLATILPELGMGSRSYTENLEFLQANIGGLTTMLSLHVQATDVHAMRPAFTIRGKALYRKAKELFTVMKEMSTSFRLDDEKRIEELVMQIHTALQNRMNRNAMRYASQLALSGFSPAVKINNIWHGLPYMKTIQAIAENIGDNMPLLLEKLHAVKDKVVSLSNPSLVLSCDAKMHSRLHKENFYGLLQLPHRATAPWGGNYPVEPAPSQGRIIASPVAFTCEAFKTVSYIHPHAPALALAAHLLDNKILHPKIREQGGAYGCGATFVPMTGHFTFHSYRDPHIARTLQTFVESAEAIASGAFEERDLEEAKFGMIQQFDSPIPPGSRAAAAYVWRREAKSHEMRQKYRDTLLALTPKEVQRVTAKEILPKVGHGVVVSFAGKELLEQENELLGQNRLPIIPI